MDMNFVNIYSPGTIEEVAAKGSYSVFSFRLWCELDMHIIFYCVIKVDVVIF